MSEAPRRSRILPVALGWFIILAAVGTLMHLDLVDRPHYGAQAEAHARIVDHAAPAPYQFRVLQPMAVEALLHAPHEEAGAPRYRAVFLGGYAGIRFLSILTTLLALYFALSPAWGGRTATLAATALAAFLPFTYRYYYYQPTSVMEMACVALGLLAIFRRSAGALLPLVILGGLNRETMIFLPLAYLLFWLPELRRREWAWLAAATLAWLAVFAGLRLLWPADANLLDLGRYIHRNLTWSRGTLDLAVILSPLLLLAFRMRRIPDPFLRLVVISLPWLLLHFLTSEWREIRYFMPLLIWLLPALLAALAEPGPEAGPEPPGQ